MNGSFSVVVTAPVLLRRECHGAGDGSDRSSGAFSQSSADQCGAAAAIAHRASRRHCAPSGAGAAPRPRGRRASAGGRAGHVEQQQHEGQGEHRLRHQPEREADQQPRYQRRAPPISDVA
jgi:hypothetical protein